MPRDVRLADLQLAIIQILWDKGHATVNDVRDALGPDRKLAYTTVGTMLAKMEAAGYVAHKNDGRVNVYRAVLRREQVSRTMVSDLAERLFQGDVAEMMCHLLDGCDVSHAELARLKQLIRDKEREIGHAE